MNRLRSLRSPAIIAFLAMTLLFAQMLGFVHGIAHAGWVPGTVHSLISEALFDEAEEDHAAAWVATSAALGSDSDRDADAHDLHDVHAHHAHHSCLDYDAAALSVGVHFDFPPLPLLPPVRLLALWQAFASWDAPLNCHFSSRAPPR
ncbi:hypothetical protein RB25_24890 [Herbaspirillum rubrisubalbicans]|uniref:DUF2946 domain-containing protein n=2 Tax=Herbaspirillum rubrisubalbicans TaxID=80842 RepID=A0ABX9BUT6_9BURK|nr:hypothetical protein [Herbaspirillum rubrisubalbicans]QJP98874.1 hypothetical protein C798_01110 [Herbaspirillum rubrisubalbicans Os34]RAM61546.1 hypothetical protein RB24_24650 [Herbaspirillum rubrisubalbicans]RAN42990.1 hypothetical protein RB25_24890 [Herbaspirillum rubrisubalbicans]